MHRPAEHQERVDGFAASFGPGVLRIKELRIDNFLPAIVAAPAIALIAISH